MRVTAVAPEAMVRRHYAESLELLRIILQERPEPVGPLVDVGSGGGFPDLVIAAVMPGLPVVLVEPLRKRARLLESAAAELALANVSVRAERAEEAGRGLLRDAAEIVTARAVAPLPELLEYTAPLARPGGLIACPKGTALDREVADAAGTLDQLCCEVAGVRPMRPAISESVRVLLVSKRGPTPDRYPRRPGMPRKRSRA